jgi:hypothetical protein
VLGMVELLKENSPAFKEGLEKIARAEGFITEVPETIPARSTGRGVVPETAIPREVDRSSQFGAEVLTPFARAPKLREAAEGAIKGVTTGVLAEGQSEGESAVDYIERLTEAFKTMQTLPKDLVFALKIDVDSPTDIFKYNSEDIEAFKRNWNVLDGLDPALEKSFAFNAIGVDENGNPRPIDDLIADTKAVNKAIQDLNSEDKDVVRKAEIQLNTLVNNNSDLSTEEIDSQIEVLRESYKDIWDSINPGVKSQIILFNALVNGLDPTKNPEEVEELRKQIESLVDFARVTDIEDKETSGGAAKESTFQRIMKNTKATKDYMNSVADLVKKGLKPENIALIDQADLLDMTVAERRKAIKAVKEQIDIQKALDYLMKSTSERRIFDLEREVKIFDRNIDLVERQIEDVEKLNKVEQDRIDTLSRQNEMDQRQVSIRSRGLELLSRKEDEVNKVYDARFEALDKVAEINERVSRQQQSRISLATALTSGDIAGAASAAAQMAAQYTQDQEEDARKALESQRQRELESLAVSINGVLMTRTQIEEQILKINDRIYDRNLEIERLEDIIYNRKQTLIRPLEEQINRIMEDRKVKIREIEDLQFSNWQKEMNRVDQLIAKYRALQTIQGSTGGGSGGSKSSSSSSSSDTKNIDTDTKNIDTKINETRSVIAQDKKNINVPPKDPRSVIAQDKKNINVPPPPLSRRDLKMYGGVISKYAMGGSVGFRGSREAPPAIKMATGDVVPGLGNTDRVPALLTPGEFVVRKSVARENMGMLKSLNSDVFPQFSKGSGIPIVTSSSVVQSANSARLYNNTYNVNVALNGNNIDPEDVANTVVAKLRRMESRQIRGLRY